MHKSGEIYRSNDKFLSIIVPELIKKYECHTIILYGSRARGDATETSDYDLLAVKRSGKSLRIAQQTPNGYLDLFIFSEKMLVNIGEEHLHMHRAKVLVQWRGFGDRLLKKLHEAYKKPYKPPVDEIIARQVWLHKMMSRAEVKDLDGEYRRTSLQEALLRDYFFIRSKRYLGSKTSLCGLRQMTKKHIKPSKSL